MSRVGVLCVTIICIWSLNAVPTAAQTVSTTTQRSSKSRVEQPGEEPPTEVSPECADLPRYEGPLTEGAARPSTRAQSQALDARLYPLAEDSVASASSSVQVKASSVDAGVQLDVRRTSNAEQILGRSDTVGRLISVDFSHDIRLASIP